MLTIDDVISRVRALAIAAPDNVYLDAGRGCYYTRGDCENGSVGCIFGQALAPEYKERLAAIDQHSACNIDDAITQLGIGADVSSAAIADRIDWCNIIQQSQDSGETWRDAVAFADSNIGVG